MTNYQAMPKTRDLTPAQVNMADKTEEVKDEDKDQMLIAQGVTSEDQVGEMICIPKVAIKSTTVMIPDKSETGGK